MAKFSTKHGDREKTFSMMNFSGGLNEEIAGHHLPVTSLTQCCNMRYLKDGDQTILAMRQGLTKISKTAGLTAYGGCTYYKAGAKYVVATSGSLWYLDGSYDPARIDSVSDHIDGTPTFTEFHGKLIIHDSGVTKAWNGTTYEKLPCRYDDVAIETGDGSTVEFDGTLANPVVTSTTLTITYTAGAASKTITSAASGALTGDVTDNELMPNAVDRNFSGASAWANVDLNAYDETGDLTITANGANQYCTCPVLSAPTTSGKVYRMTFTVANLVSTWIIKSFDGTQTIGTVSTAGAQNFVWTATTTGGYRIVAGSATSSGDFDDFTLSGCAINYTTGAYHFTASTAPDKTTPVYVTYEKTNGAPKSKAGFVRGSRLYMWGDSDYPSRLWYSGVNDEDAWDSSSGGGYIDIDPLDGYALMGCCNFFNSVICLKENSIHRLNNFPGETNFRVEPVLQGVGTSAYRTCIVAGNYVSFLSTLGWLGLSATSDYGDVTMTEDFGKNLRSDIIPWGISSFANDYCYAEYNEIDKQLWLAITGAYVIVCNLETGGQLSLYRFASTHTYFKYVNGEMLVCGTDGHLYKLNNTAAGTTCKDGSTSYSTYTYVRGAMTDWGLKEHRKHNKFIKVHLYGPSTVTATLTIYKNKDYSTAIHTASLSTADTSTKISKKFNYQEVMFKLADIYGSAGAEFAGVEFEGAVIGR